MAGEDVQPVQRKGFPFTESDTAFSPANGKSAPRADTFMTDVELASTSQQKEGAGVHSTQDVSFTNEFDATKEDHFGEAIVVKDAKDVLTHALHVDDDPSLSPWTFRAFCVACGLATFASVLQEIYYFKPQAIYVSVVFLTVIGYALGELMALIIPRKGRLGTVLNPFELNSKEHAFIAIMASSAATNAVSTEILAAQRLYYDMDPSPIAAVFLIISSQLLGFGIAGLLRNILVQPTRMLWPVNLPVVSLLEALHRDKKESRSRLRVFWAVFGLIFVWEIIPEWMFPVLQGVSIFCLAKQNSVLFTNLFGGSRGNEGLGFLSLSFDWQYIASLGSPFEYNLSLILNEKNEINNTGVAEHGVPYLTGTYVGYLITTNMGLTATLVQMMLWNYEDVKAGWYFLRPSNPIKLLKLKTWLFWKNQKSQEEHKHEVLADPSKDPHYKLMVSNDYEEVPNWWYGNILVLSFVVGMATIYSVKSTLPWWGFIISNMFAALFILFFGAQMGITGFQFNQQPIIQMIAGYIHPGKPLANMYFTVFGFNGVQQGQWLLRDLKIAQLAHLSPKSTFVAQTLGAVIGALFNYIMMKTIVSSQREILISVHGSNVWSGQNVQQYNTLAIAWSIAHDMFSIGARYQYVTIAYLIGFFVPVPFWLLYRYTRIEFFKFLNLTIVLWYMGWLFVGINSSIASYFLLGFFAQYYLRIYQPVWFIRWNYLVSVGLDGGTQVMVFILSFSVFGGSGKQRRFPTWWGNNGGWGGVERGRNIDYCMFDKRNA